MDRPQIEDIKSLVRGGGTPCISIYLPYFASGNETEQNAIRLKNALHEAEKLLADRVKRGSVAKLLKPGFDILEEEKTTTYAGRGLAMFLNGDSSVLWRLPVRFIPLVADGTQFHIKPLLPYVFSGGDYLILAISLESARLFKATRFELDRIDIPELERGIEHTLRFDDSEKQLQSDPSAIDSYRSFHGHDVAHENDRSNSTRYCEEINRTVMPVIGEMDRPLVIVAEDFLQSEFARISHYSGPKITARPKNPDSLTDEQLLKHVWPEVEAYLSEPLKAAIRSYERLSGGDITSNHLETVLRAAGNGRVETMVIDPDAYIWGRFNAENGKLEAHTTQRPGDDDLFDIAAASVLMNGGKVFTAARESIPEGSQVAAVFRY